MPQAKFDWYQPTINAGLPEITGVLLGTGLFSHVKDSETGGMGYRQRRHFHQANGDCHVRLYHDGAQNPSLQISGDITPDLVEVVRSQLPDHTVSRMDVAMDFHRDPDLFGELRDELELVSRANGVLSGYGIIPREEDKGATFYLGSKKSEAQCRLYEKAKQLFSLGRITAEQFAQVCHWIRLEFQFRPNKPGDKKLLASLSPQEALGWSRWVRKANERIFSLHLPIFERTPHVTCDIDKSMEHLLHQFGPFLFRRAEQQNRLHYGIVNPTKAELLEILCKDLGEKLLNHRAWNKPRDVTVEDYFAEEE